MKRKFRGSLASIPLRQVSELQLMNNFVLVFHVISRPVILPAELFSIGDRLLFFFGQSTFPDGELFCIGSRDPRQLDFEIDTKDFFV